MSSGPHGTVGIVRCLYCVSRSSWNSRYCVRLVGRCLYCVFRSSWNSKYCERLLGRCLYCVSRSSWNSRYCERLVERCLYCVSRSSWNSRYCERLVGRPSSGIRRKRFHPGSIWIRWALIRSRHVPFKTCTGFLLGFRP